MNPTRVVIADDHPVFRSSLRMILEREPGITVVAEAADGLQAVEMVEQHRPDVLLIDVRLPRIDGLQATRIVSGKFPDTKVIVLTLFTDDGTRAAAIEAGARYCWAKDSFYPGMLAEIRR